MKMTARVNDETCLTRTMAKLRDGRRLISASADDTGVPERRLSLAFDNVLSSSPPFRQVCFLFVGDTAHERG